MAEKAHPKIKRKTRGRSSHESRKMLFQGLWSNQWLKAFERSSNKRMEIFLLESIVDTFVRGFSEL